MRHSVGIVGGIVISRWAIGLLRETSSILLDGQAAEPLVARIRSILESDADTRVCDLHVWRTGSRDAAAVISLVTHYPRLVEHYRALVASIPDLRHVTIEINKCTGEPCLPIHALEVEKAT